ncbi:hypothetical protein [Nocardioides sp.]|uniref:hypothetical protein n=1 Tax=Nocardioides sp. TaxID=35761 RepID=UPI0035676915
MHLRRPLALCAGALALSLGVLTSCGFDLATDRPYTPGVGANNRDADVDVLAAVIVAAQPNEATFIATLVNNTETDASLTGVSGGVDVAPFEPIEVASRDYVNLADGDGVLVTGDFDAGQVIELTLTMSTGEAVTLNVPVVRACEEYLGLDLTGKSTFIPYDCSAEPPAAGEH